MTAPDDVADIYVPGAWRCPTCGFQLTEATMSATTGEIGTTLAQAMQMGGRACPNDEAPMVRVRWRERADEHYAWGVQLMNDLLTATATHSLPDALTHVRRLQSVVAGAVSIDCVHCSRCGKRCSQDVIAPHAEGMTGIVIRAFVQCPECLEKPLEDD